MKEEWLFPAALIPVDRETTHALVAEIKRLIDVVGGMALAQPEQEPVAWEQFYPDIGKPQLKQELVGFIEAKADNECADAYADGWNACVHAHKDTTPPKRPWVGLTDVKRDEILDIYLTAEGRARAIEAELKELNT